MDFVLPGHSVAALDGLVGRRVADIFVPLPSSGRRSTPLAEQTDPFVQGSFYLQLDESLFCIFGVTEDWQFSRSVYEMSMIACDELVALPDDRWPWGDKVETESFREIVPLSAAPISSAVVISETGTVKNQDGEGQRVYRVDTGICLSFSDGKRWFFTTDNEMPTTVRLRLACPAA